MLPAASLRPTARGLMAAAPIQRMTGSRLWATLVWGLVRVCVHGWGTVWFQLQCLGTTSGTLPYLCNLYSRRMLNGNQVEGLFSSTVLQATHKYDCSTPQCVLYPKDTGSGGICVLHCGHQRLIFLLLLSRAVKTWLRAYTDPGGTIQVAALAVLGTCQQFWCRWCSMGVVRVAG